MKKTYQKPEAYIEELAFQQLLGASIIEGVNADPASPVFGREFPIFDEIEIEE